MAKKEYELHHQPSKKKPVHHSKSFKLIFQLVITAGFFFVELIVGYAGNSMALVADSFHMLSDVISLLIGLLAVRMASKRTRKNTFGWVRAEVLGALVNSVFLLALCFTIFIEAIKRIIETEPVEKPDLVLYVGIIGLIINVIGMIVFSHHHTHDHGGHSHKGHNHADHGSNKHDHSHHHNHDNHHHMSTPHHQHNTSSRVKNKHTNNDHSDHETTTHNDHEHDDVDSENHQDKFIETQNGENPDVYISQPSLSRQQSEDADEQEAVLNSNSSPRRNTMSSQLVAPSFTCYFCRNSIPAASRFGTQPESCNNCAEAAIQPETNMPTNYQEGEVLMNGSKSKIDKNGSLGHGDRLKNGSAKKKKDNKPDHMNIRGVFLHIMGDFLGSIIVCITAGILMVCDRYAYCGERCLNPPVSSDVPCWTLYLDPCLSIIMVIIILSSTIPLLKESAFILLQTVPTHIQIDRVQSELLEQVPSIKGMHELHVWQLAGNRIIASAHVQCQSPQEYTQMASAIKNYFHDMGIHSTTIQPEFIDTQTCQGGGDGGSTNVPSSRHNQNHLSHSSEGNLEGKIANATRSTSYVGTAGNFSSDSPANNQACLLMCGPEKSCSDKELCCPREKVDELRKRGPSSGNGSNCVDCVQSSSRPFAEVSVDLSGTIAHRSKISVDRDLENMGKNPTFNSDQRDDERIVDLRNLSRNSSKPAPTSIVA